MPIDSDRYPLLFSTTTKLAYDIDNFYYGRPFQYALWRLPKGCRQLELRILPLQKDMPVYFPREADTTPGEEVKQITIINQ